MEELSRPNVINNHKRISVQASQFECVLRNKTKWDPPGCYFPIAWERSLIPSILFIWCCPCGTCAVLVVTLYLQAWEIRLDLVHHVDELTEAGWRVSTLEDDRNKVHDCVLARSGRHAWNSNNHRVHETRIPGITFGDVNACEAKTRVVSLSWET
jgi:hypothetical protein